ncbi:MAG: VOC family protein [Deltaproteobacteria bacterium]|nr:VOC family protein [Deltaproteobacteria bacterium]
MTEKPGPGLSKIAQIGMVVKSVDESVRRYWDLLGMGPWAIYTFKPGTVTNMTVAGKPQEYAMRIAIATIGAVMWELIEPLDDRSIYGEHLRKHGEGLHHILFDTEDYGRAMSYFKEKGVAHLQGGKWGPLSYDYLGTEEALHFIAELYHVEEGKPLPEPEATYPPS